MPKKTKKAAKKSTSKNIAKKAEIAPTPQAVHKRPSKVQAALLAFLIIGLLSYIVNGILLTPVWNAMDIAGVLRGGDNTMAMVVYFVLVLVVAIVLTVIVSKMRIVKATGALGIGLLLGVIPAFMEAYIFLFYRVPPIVLIAGVCDDLVAFMLATLAIWSLTK